MLLEINHYLAKAKISFILKISKTIFKAGLAYVIIMKNQCMGGRCHLARRFCTFSFIRSFLSHAVKPYFPNFLKVHERDLLLTLLWSGQYLVVFS